MTFEQMWRDLAPVGRVSSGGYYRQPFGSAERECHSWFIEQAFARGLVVESDALGLQTTAWWRPDPRQRSGGVLTGSHLDSVLEGGAFDGPLGVVSALAAIDVLRDRGFTPARPIGVGVFLEEEGSRFGLACLGSRVVTGQVGIDRLRSLRDPDGVWFLDAAAAGGVHLAEDDALDCSETLRDEVSCYVELHVEQGRNLVERGAPVGAASAIWPHGRYRFDFAGEANHAGTTHMADRADPMMTYAMTALAANKQARLGGQRATFGRLEIRPNATNAVPSHVTAWLDARAESEEDLEKLLAEVGRMSHERAERDGTTVEVTAESVTPEVRFDPGLTMAVAGGRPIIPTAAGHDAGVLAEAGIPSAMLFVRNPTGVSHSPHEHAEMADCLAGVEALADALQELCA
ncbi:MAG TPA: allantoate amidohydrolase [Nocardioidaceae bacterium]|nr:allantoate amidohydrolase [Nocardioidaceae bacterium]